MTNFRMESAMRMEFRPLGDAVAVFNDDRRVATIQGGFVEFWNKAELSIDEVALIVKYARETMTRASANRKIAEGVIELARLLGDDPPETIQFVTGGPAPSRIIVQISGDA